MEHSDERKMLGSSIINSHKQVESTHSSASSDTIEDRFITGFVVFRLGLDNEMSFLLLERRKLIGDWSPPKGHMEPGESQLEAAYRELKEETSVEPHDVDIFPCQIDFEYEHQKPGKKKVMKKVSLWAAFLKDYNHAIEISTEHRALTWEGKAGALRLIKWQYRSAFEQILHHFQACPQCNQMFSFSCDNLAHGCT